ncbi:MAG: hypothetical protein WDN28_07240 [Chthoniobacter sp.]
MGRNGSVYKARRSFAEQAHPLVDFYHVSEYLAAAAATCRPRAPDHWRRTQQRRLRRGASAQVLAALDPHQESAHLPEEQAPVRAAHRYLSHRLDQLDYPRALRLNLPIGFGLIESGHRHVLMHDSNAPAPPGSKKMPKPSPNSASCAQTAVGCNSGTKAPFCLTHF